MNHALKPLLLLVFLSGLLLVFIGTFAGDPVYYTIGSYSIIVITIISFLIIRSSKTLLLLVIAIHLFLRYIPILKYNQPLLNDPIYELATASEFEKNGRINVLPARTTDQSRSLMYQSGWPLVHLLAITIHQATGLSLFNVFTYFSPIIDLSSLLFVYLFASHIFKNERIGVFSALIYATFYVNIYWTGIELIRQNIAYSLMLMSLYFYVKGRTEKKRKLLALTLLTFGILPIAHHLTPIEIFYAFLLWFFFELSFSFGRKLRALVFHTISFKKSISNSFPLFLCFFVCVATFLWWVSYAQEIIIPMFASVVQDAILRMVNLSPTGQFQENVRRTGEVFSFSRAGIYDILSYLRVLFIAIATLYGIFVLAKEKTPHRFILYGLIFAPLSLFVIGFLVVGGFEVVRQLVFLIIPSFVITAKIMQKFNRKILVLGLLIILLPAPFELFDAPSTPAPTFIYNKYSTGNIVLTRDVFYREDTVLAAASFFSSHSSGPLTADSYTEPALMRYYDPYRVLPTGYIMGFLAYPNLIYKSNCTILIHGPYFDTKFLLGFSRGIFKYSVISTYEKYNVTLSFEDLENYRDRFNSFANHVYDNGEVIGWKSPL